MPALKYKESLVGQHFGSWRVLRDPVDGGVRRLVSVVCGCGFYATRIVNNLVRGRTRACNTCASRERAKRVRPFSKGGESWAAR